MTVLDVLTLWVGRAVIAFVAIVALRWFWNSWGCAMGDHGPEEWHYEWPSNLLLEKRCKWCGDVRKIERCSSCKSVWIGRHLDGCKLAEGRGGR